LQLLSHDTGAQITGGGDLAESAPQLAQFARSSLSLGAKPIPVFRKYFVHIVL
jgi:hypothetical protein